MVHENRNRPAGNGAAPEGWQATTRSVRDHSDTPRDLNGLEAAELNTYTPHAETFRHAVEVLANSRLEFTIDDVLELVGHPVLGSVGAHGALMAKAAAGRRLQPVGYTHSKRTGGIVRVWSGYGGAP